MSRAQVLAAGIPAHAIDHRVRDGRLEVLFRGVYRVPGPVAGQYEREMAAVLACGAGAVLSHGSAASIWGPLAIAGSAARSAAGPPTRPPARSPAGPSDATHPAVEVTVVAGFRVPGASVRVHRVEGFDPGHRTVSHGIPITTPARTIVDLAATATARELEQALAAAEREGLASREDVARVLASQPRRRGAGVLRALLARAEAPSFTRSEAEERFLSLVLRAGLPAPATNVRVRGIEVDFLWRAARLVVEIDGFAFHRSQAAFERDRRRDRVLLAAGYRVLRVTWRQLRDHPDPLLVSLVQSLMIPAGR